MPHPHEPRPVDPERRAAARRVGPDAAAELLEARARDGPDGDREERISKTLASFRCCVDIMVDVGERCLLRLPPNVLSRSICGMVIRGLVEAYVDGDEFPLQAERPLSYLAPKRRSVFDPLRYSEAVANASKIPCWIGAGAAAKNR